MNETKTVGKHFVKLKISIKIKISIEIFFPRVTAKVVFFTWNSCSSYQLYQHKFKHFSKYHKYGSPSDSDIRNIFLYMHKDSTQMIFCVSFKVFFSQQGNFLCYVDKFPVMNNIKSDNRHLLLLLWYYGSPNRLSFFLLYNDIPLPLAF